MTLDADWAFGVLAVFASGLGLGGSQSPIVMVLLGVCGLGLIVADITDEPEKS